MVSAIRTLDLGARESPAPASPRAIGAGRRPVEIRSPGAWGSTNLPSSGGWGPMAATSTTFYAGWYRARRCAAPRPTRWSCRWTSRPTSPGDTATLRIVPRAAGTALVTVLSNRLVAMQAVEVTEGENLIQIARDRRMGGGRLCHGLGPAADGRGGGPQPDARAWPDPCQHRPRRARSLTANRRGRARGRPARAAGRGGQGGRHHGGRDRLCHHRRGRSGHPEPDRALRPPIRKTTTSASASWASASAISTVA